MKIIITEQMCSFKSRPLGEVGNLMLTNFYILRNVMKNYVS